MIQFTCLGKINIYWLCDWIVVRLGLLALQRSSRSIGDRTICGPAGGYRSFLSLSLGSVPARDRRKGWKGKPLCEWAELPNRVWDEGSRRLGKPGISWTSLLPSFGIRRVAWEEGEGDPSFHLRLRLGVVSTCLSTATTVGLTEFDCRH